MKNNLYFLLLSIILIHFSPLANAQSSLSSHNLTYQYSPDAEADLQIKSTQIGDTLSLYVTLNIYQNKPILNDYSFEVYTAGSYKEKLNTVSAISVDTLHANTKNREYLFQFKFLASEVRSIIGIRLYSNFSGLSYFFDHLPKKNQLLLASGKNQFRLNPWLPPGSYHFNIDEQLYGFYYQHHFPPALPPMPVNIDIPERSMTVDSTFVLSGSAGTVLEKQGLYLFQLDSSSNQGISYRVENKYYPKLTQLEQLIAPLIYITTKEENQKLQSIQGDKKLFDRFWLDLTQSPERAKNIIKNYYDRVEQANQFFTTYKEGWKTDMGMIYIIFGPPDEVTKTETGQNWSYLTSPLLPKIRFDFVRTENIFSPSHYTLIREKKYANTWFRAIDLWRKGRF